MNFKDFAGAFRGKCRKIMSILRDSPDDLPPQTYQEIPSAETEEIKNIPILADDSDSQPLQTVSRDDETEIKNIPILLNEDAAEKDIFSIEYRGMVNPVCNNYESADDFFGRVLNIREITDYLAEKKDDADFRRFSVTFSEYEKSVSDMIAKIRTDKKYLSIPEIVSETVTSRIFFIISNSLLKNVMSSLRDDEENKFPEFIRIINEYLSSLGIYTCAEVSAGEKLKDKHMQFYEITAFPTDKKESHGIVKKVNILPYCIKYRSTSGSISELRMAGRIFVCSVKYRKEDDNA